MDELDNKILTTEWKTTSCNDEGCWCAIIEPVVEIRSDGGHEMYIASSGCIPKVYAEHIVKVHNEYVRSLKTD
jgi:hypothetical protein